MQPAAGVAAEGGRDSQAGDGPTVATGVAHGREHGEADEADGRHDGQRPDTAQQVTDDAAQAERHLDERG